MSIVKQGYPYDWSEVIVDRYTKDICFDPSHTFSVDQNIAVTNF